MGQRTQILVLKTIHLKNGTKAHKNELYHAQWGLGRTMFMALMAGLWKNCYAAISSSLKDFKEPDDYAHHPFSYQTIDHPSVININEEFDDGMEHPEISEERMDKFLSGLDNNDGYMIVYHDIYETESLRAKEDFRVIMKQSKTFKSGDKLISMTPEKYMKQFPEYCTPDFIKAWKSFVQYKDIDTTLNKKAVF